MSPSLEGHLTGPGCFLCIRLLFHFPFSKHLVYVESNSWEGRLSQLLDLGSVFCISNLGVGKCDNTVSPESGGPGTSPGFPPAMGLHDSEMSWDKDTFSVFSSQPVWVCTVPRNGDMGVLQQQPNRLAAFSVALPCTRILQGLFLY